MRAALKPTLVSIIIPVYNESTSLAEVLDRVLKADLPPGCDREVIVVDDGSTDGTTELLEGVARDPFVSVHDSVVNLGKGAAVRVGIAKSRGDIVLAQDGDLEYDPSDYVALLTPLVEGHADVVYGTRFHTRPQGMAWKNWFANRILTLSANVLFGAGITDEATGYKAFRSDVLRAVKLRCLRFEFCPEITSKLRRIGYRIHEVPIRYNARGVESGKKIRWRDGVQAIWTMLRYRFAARSSFVRIHD
jgi:glycosyltransferase involved in cell wall biosynthesis